MVEETLVRSDEGAVQFDGESQKRSVIKGEAKLTS
jgi:hypothetical protein